MSKILITADLHLHDFRQHNLCGDAQFRLHQFQTLALRFIEIIQDYQCQHVIIAGDFFHVAAPRPHVVNAGFQFLKQITQKTGVKILLTHGQHDLDTRSVIQRDSTLLNICENLTHVAYLHKHQLSIDGRTVYFLGWCPEWTRTLQRELSQPVDIVIGHTAPHNVKIGQYDLELKNNNFIPDDLFTIGFFGDIHYHQSRDNWVVPGTPIMHSFNDKPDPGVLIFDTDDLSWEQVKTRTEKFPFLELLITDEASHDPYTVSRARTRSLVQQTYQQVFKSLHVLDVIQQVIEQTHTMRTKELHTEVFAELHLAHAFPDLNFQLQHVKIHNFRSILEYDMELDPGVKLVSGPNGSGKSTLVNAITYCLFDGQDPRKSVHKDAKEMFVELELQYQNLEHTIRRSWNGSGKTTYWINKQEIQAENQRQLVDMIKHNLPFIDSLDLVRFTQDRTGFLVSYNYAQRASLLSKLLGLELLEQINAVCDRKMSRIETEIYQLQQKLMSCKAVLAQENTLLLQAASPTTETQESYTQYVKTRRTIQDNLSVIRSQQQSLQSTRTKYTTEISLLENDLQTIAHHVKSTLQKVCFACQQPIPDRLRLELIGKGQAEIKQLGEKLKTKKQELETLPAIDSSLFIKFSKTLEDLSGKISRYESERKHAEQLERLQVAVATAKREQTDYLQRIHALKLNLEAFQDYKQLFGPSGRVIISILDTLSEILSCDTIKVITYKTLLVSEETRPDFSLEMLVGDSWIGYDDLSGGQRTLADMYILERLIQIAGGTGLLVFDETLKYLDHENTDIVVNTIKQFAAKTIFIVSHQAGFPYYDTLIEAKLGTHGSEYSIL